MIKIEITYDPGTGSCELSGPLDQTVLCYGLLERARDLLQAHAAKREGAAGNGHPSIVVPEIRLSGPLRG